MPTRNGHDTIADRRRRAPRIPTMPTAFPAPTPKRASKSVRPSTSPAPAFPRDIHLPPAPGNSFSPPPKRGTKAKPAAKPAQSPRGQTAAAQTTAITVTKPKNSGQSNRKSPTASPQGAAYQADLRKAGDATAARPARKDIARSGVLTATQNPAIALPQSSEPQVLSAPPKPDPSNAMPERVEHQPHTPASALPVSPTADLPRNRALTSPSQGLIGAITTWLRSTRQRVVSSFLVTKRRPVSAKIQRQVVQASRKVPAPPITRSEQADVVQLLEENRRLRAELDALMALRTVPQTQPAAAKQAAASAPLEKPNTA